MSTRTGTTGIAPFVIQDDAIPQPAAYADQLNKGWHARNTITERDAMPLHYRGWGMVCVVTNDGSNNGVYQLTRPSSGIADDDDGALMENGNWKPFSASSSSLSLDEYPSANSIKPVKSQGIKNYVDGAIFNVTGRVYQYDMGDGGWREGDIWLVNDAAGNLQEIRKITSAAYDYTMWSLKIGNGGSILDTGDKIINAVSHNAYETTTALSNTTGNDGDVTMVYYGNYRYNPNVGPNQDSVWAKWFKKQGGAWQLIATCVGIYTHPYPFTTTPPNPYDAIIPDDYGRYIGAIDTTTNYWYNWDTIHVVAQYEVIASATGVYFGNIAMDDHYRIGDAVFNINGSMVDNVTLKTGIAWEHFNFNNIPETQTIPVVDDLPTDGAGYDDGAFILVNYNNRDNDNRWAQWYQWSAGANAWSGNLLVLGPNSPFVYTVPTNTDNGIFTYQWPHTAINLSTGHLYYSNQEIAGTTAIFDGVYKGIKYVDDLLHLQSEEPFISGTSVYRWIIIPGDGVFYPVNSFLYPVDNVNVFPGANPNYGWQRIVKSAPEPLSYTTDEQDTGMLWVDGKKIYQKVYKEQMGSPIVDLQPGSFSLHNLSVPHSVADIENIISIKGYIEAFENFSGSTLAGDRAKFLLNGEYFYCDINSGSDGITSTLNLSFRVTCKPTFPADTYHLKNLFIALEYTKINN